MSGCIKCWGQDYPGCANCEPARATPMDKWGWFTSKDQLVVRILMEYLQKNARGRKNATPRDQVLRHLRLYVRDLQDRKFRDTYSRLPICSTAKGDPKGIFIPTTAEEVEAFREELFEKVPGPIAISRYRTILAYYPHLAPVRGVQKELFG